MIAAVVLAAGTSTRFGSQKLLAQVRGAPLVRRTVEQVLTAGLDDVLIVLGREAQAVRAALDDLPVRFVVNPDYRDGLSTSLRSGLRDLGRTFSAVIVVLGDQPGISGTTIASLIEEYRRSRQPIVVPVYAGTRGNPVLFDASLFPELEAVAGDQGGREVIGRDASRVATVSLPFAMPADVDTIEDHRSLVDDARHTA